MKRKLLFIIATVFLVAACHNDDYMPGLPAPGNEDNETEMAEQVAGRVALGYVTYYGTSIYNPQIEMFARFKMKSSFHKTKRII